MNQKEFNFSKTVLPFSAKLSLFRVSSTFSIMNTTIVLLYSILVGVDISLSKDSLLLTTVSILDNLLIGYFILEILLKLYVEEDKKNFFKDKWNLFDTIIISLSLLPMGLVTENIIILRLLRIFKVLRVISGSSGIKQTINLILASIPSIFNILLLLFIIFYIYAVIGITLFNNVHWQDFPSAILSLFRVFTFDWYSLLREVSDNSSYAWIYFISFFILNTIIILNVLIAILVDEISRYREKKIHNDIKDEANLNRQILDEITIIKKQLLKKEENVL